MQYAVHIAFYKFINEIWDEYFVLAGTYRRMFALDRVNLFLAVPLVLSAFTHLWNPVGFPDFFYDEGVYMRRAMHLLAGFGPEEAGRYFDHPYFGQLFLAGIFKLIGYPDSINPRVTEVHSIEELWLVPRFLMGFLAIGDTFIIYRICEKRYSSNRAIAFIASVLFAVMPITWLTRRVLLDSIMLPMFLLSILFAVYASTSKRPLVYPMKGLKQLRRKIVVLVILSGILLGIAIFTKVPAVTMIPLVGYLIYRNTRNSIKHLGLWLIPVIAIPLAWPIFANSIGQYDDWLAGLSNQVERENAGFLGIIRSFFTFDPILLILGLIGLIYATIKKDITLALWIIPFSIFLFLVGYGIYFYIIPLIPAFCIGAAILIVGLPSDIGVAIRKIATRARLLYGRKNKDQDITKYLFDGQSLKYDIKSHHSTIDTPKRYSSLVSKYLPYIILSVIGVLGLTSSVMLITTNVSSAQFEATALAAEYIIKNPDDLSVVSGPVYSWIYKYVLGMDNVGNSFLDIDWQDIQNGNVLLVADNHFRSSMLDYTEKDLYLAYNDSADMVTVNEKGPGYDMNRYPYTNLRASREGDSIELKAGLVPFSDQQETTENGDISSETFENGNDAVTDPVNDNLLMHNHTRLEILMDGTPITIPANIGIDPSLHHDRSLDRYGAQKSPIVTYTTSGTIHVESRIIANYTLGEFLDIWGFNVADKIVKFTSGNQPLSDYRNHILKDGERLKLILCTELFSHDPYEC